MVVAPEDGPYLLRSLRHKARASGEYRVERADVVLGKLWGLHPADEQCRRGGHAGDALLLDILEDHIGTWRRYEDYFSAAVKGTLKSRRAEGKVMVYRNGNAEYGVLVQADDLRRPLVHECIIVVCSRYDLGNTRGSS